MSSRPLHVFQQENNKIQTQKATKNQLVGQRDLRHSTTSNAIERP
jgi:hypothetical protein